jgi:hypothetical protein
VYIDRLYRFHDTLPELPVPAPMNSPIGLSLSFSGYFAIAFLHDDRTFSIVFAHDGTDRRLRELRHGEVFESAVASIPQLAEWTDPGRARSIAPVLPGGKLYNGYRGQLDTAGRPFTPGLISVGDAVCTTTPLAGRGVTLALAQSRALVGALQRHGSDIDSATEEFDRWCTVNLKPWFDDHVHNDSDRLRRWSGGDVDTTRRLPSDLIVAAAAADESLRPSSSPTPGWTHCRTASTPPSRAHANCSPRVGAPPNRTARPAPSWPNCVTHGRAEPLSAASRRRAAA